VIKDRIREAADLPLTVGGGATRFIAKLASAYDKPDGMCIIPAGEEAEFVAGLELDDLWGLGKKTLARLRAFNINSVADLRTMPKHSLRGYFGEAAGEYLYRAARGIDPGIFSGRAKTHSISNERTFQEDLTSDEAVSSQLLALAHEVMFRAMTEQAEGRTVQVKFRDHSFKTRTARRTLDHAVSSGEELYQVGRDVLMSRWDRRTPLRLLGIGLTGVQPEGTDTQGELFEEGQDERRREVEKAVLDLKRKFRGTRIEKARFIQPDDPSGEDKGSERG
jgi:DNA polymerase-4